MTMSQAQTRESRQVFQRTKQSTYDCFEAFGKVLKHHGVVRRVQFDTADVTLRICEDKRVGFEDRVRFSGFGDKDLKRVQIATFESLEDPLFLQINQSRRAVSGSSNPSTSMSRI